MIRLVLVAAVLVPATGCKWIEDMRANQGSAPRGTGPVAPMEAWRPFVGPTAGVRYTDVNAFETHVVVGRRRDGLTGASLR